MAKRKPHDRPAAVAATRWDWLTTAGFFLAVALVIARVMMQDILREPFTATPGAELPPRGAGPAAQLTLNLLCLVPAILVLARRWLDREYRLSGSWDCWAYGRWPRHSGHRISSRR